jgi:hypothetical protein
MNDRLIDFHLGLVGDGERAEIEEALLTSPAALREYLTLKRAFDLGATSAERPSAATRERVRAALRPRRVPRAVYPAVLALAMGVALAVGLLGRSPPRPPGVRVDATGTTSPSAEIL